LLCRNGVCTNPSSFAFNCSCNMGYELDSDVFGLAACNPINSCSTKMRTILWLHIYRSWSECVQLPSWVWAEQLNDLYSDWQLQKAEWWVSRLCTLRLWWASKKSLWMCQWLSVCRRISRQLHRYQYSNEGLFFLWSSGSGSRNRRSPHFRGPNHSRYHLHSTTPKVAKYRCPGELLCCQWVDSRFDEVSYVCDSH
jgi:hypothetical protein